MAQGHRRPPELRRLPEEDRPGDPPGPAGAGLSFGSPSAQAPGLQVRVLGVPIRFELGFFLIAALLGFGLEDPTLIALWIGVLTVSVLLHEVGHAVAMRMAGLSPRIVLHPFGGVTVGSGPLSRGKSIAVTLAGPLSALFLLGIPALLVERSATDLSDTADAAVAFLVWVNVWWSLVNLLPIVPLDGGNVSRSLLGDRTALGISMVVAAGGAVFALRNNLPFAGIFAAMLAFDNFRQFKALDGGPAPGRTPGRDPLRDGVLALRKGEYVQALQASRELQSSRDPQRRHAAAELQAWTQLAAGDLDGARSTIAALPSTQHPTGHLWFCLRNASPTDVEPTVRAWLDGTAVPPPPFYSERLAQTGALRTVVQRLVDARTERGDQAAALIQHDLFNAGHYDASTAVGERIVTDGHGDRALAAYNAACAQARLGRRSSALDWLEAARRHGFTSLDLLDNDPDLASLRAERRFADLRRAVAGT